MRILASAIALLALLALTVPASAQPTEPIINEPCTNTSGKTVLTLDQPFSDTIDTPGGVPPFLPETLPAGTGRYLVDLQGLEEGERRSVTFTLTMLTAGVEATPLSDYDLIVNGENLLSTDQPERYTVSSAAHCQTIFVDTTVFTGTPLDTLTLDAAISTFSF